MANRSVKVAASMAIAAGIIVAIIIFATGGGSTVAMAAVLEQLQTMCYEFEMTVQAADGSGGAPLKCMVLEPGRMRVEQGSGPGAVVCVTDDAGQSLILFERSKTAFRMDRDGRKDVKSLSFFFLSKRSIDDLWSLKAGDETSLGKKDIDGTTAEGFRVTQKAEEHTQTITMWANAKTGRPVEVETALRSKESEKDLLKLTMRRFRVIPEPNKALFSTKVPAGYTLANQRTIDQLMAESDAAATAQAQAVLDAIALWTGGKKPQAVERLMAVDWSEGVRFGQEHYLFTMTEREYISLVSADQQKAMATIIAQQSQCRALARELVALGGKARTAKDTALAEKYFTTTVHLGQLLNSSKDMMLLLRLVGISIQRLALTELSSLYKELGDTEKLRDTQAQLKQIEEQQASIKKSASGG